MNAYIVSHLQIVNAGFSWKRHVPPVRTAAYARNGPQLERRQTSAAGTQNSVPICRLVICNESLHFKICYSHFILSHVMCVQVVMPDFGTRKSSTVESRRKCKLNALRSYRPYQLYVKVAWISNEPIEWWSIGNRKCTRVFLSCKRRHLKVTGQIELGLG